MRTTQRTQVWYAAARVHHRRGASSLNIRVTGQSVYILDSNYADKGEGVTLCRYMNENAVFIHVAAGIR